MSEKVTVTPEEKSRIAKLFESYNKDPKSITEDDRSFLNDANDRLWTICKNHEESYDVRSGAFNFIRMTHAILGRNFNPDWAPKEKKKGGKGSPWISTPEQRSKNVDECIKKIGKERWDQLKPFEQAQIIASVWGSVKQ